MPGDTHVNPEAGVNEHDTPSATLAPLPHSDPDQLPPVMVGATHGLGVGDDESNTQVG